MNKNKVGEFLASKRNQLGLSCAEMAQRIGCNRSTVERIEKGISGIRRTSINRYAKGYEVELSELVDLCGYSADSIPVSAADSEITASIEDLEFLITVTRGLQKPMNIVTIRALLKCRQAK